MSVTELKADLIVAVGEQPGAALCLPGSWIDLAGCLCPIGLLALKAGIMTPAAVRTMAGTMALAEAIGLIYAPLAARYGVSVGFLLELIHVYDREQRADLSRPEHEVKEAHFRAVLRVLEVTG